MAVMCDCSGGRNYVIRYTMDAPHCNREARYSSGLSGSAFEEEAEERASFRLE